jgi:uncharacterized membrane protein YfcA
MEIVGYIASVFIGLSLGLIGGGGSILTVPVLVYLFHVETLLAMSYALFVVGFSSVVGSLDYLRNGLVNQKMALLFGVPSILAVFATKNWIVPAIPDEIMTIGSFVLTKAIFVMVLFSILMIAASYSMIRPGEYSSSKNQTIRYEIVVLLGLIVGFLTGLVGIGGGFLIIPALVLLTQMPMKEAIGTSLVIIAANSIVGFLRSMGMEPIDWIFLLKVAAFATLGIFIGTNVSKKIDGSKLKPAFGWFVLVMGIYILIRETLLT